MEWKDFLQSGPLVAMSIAVMGLLIALLSVVYRIEGRMDGLEREISNHITTYIRELKEDGQKRDQNIDDLKDDGQERDRKIDGLKEDMRRIEDKLDRLIEK